MFFILCITLNSSTFLIWIVDKTGIQEVLIQLHYIILYKLIKTESDLEPFCKGSDLSRSAAILTTGIRANQKAGCCPHYA